MYDFYLSREYRECLNPYMFNTKNGEHGKITYFRANDEQLNKWLQQNRAEYTGDFIPGVLLDSFIVGIRRGYAFIYETYLNGWESDYTIYFQAGGADDLWPAWYERENEYIKEYGGLE